jgi:two-component system OmpR family sensor kinase
VLNRIPIQLRLTLVFAATMAIALSVTGLVVYARFRVQIISTVDTNLRAQAGALLPVIESSSTRLKQAVLNPLVRGHENLIQVLSATGGIVAATPGLDRMALITDGQLHRSLTKPQLITRGEIAPLPEGARLFTTPVTEPDHTVGILIVGASLDEQTVALSKLIQLLEISGPIALLLAWLGGYLLASAALRPVELMRRRAAAVSAHEPGVRLPLPPANDEIRRLGHTLNKMLGRLEEAFAHERLFVANASHELRTPLATMKAELELALRRERPAEELREALHSAQSEVDRLSSLADDLLVLARADAGRLPLRRSQLSVSEMLGTLRDRFDPRGERVRVDAPAGTSLVADPQRLEQALGNLLDNALRYSGGDVTLRAVTVADDSIELHVEDTGPGFPDEFIDHAFERFSRADPGRGGHGAGLGLSIVRMIAEAHGGETGVENRPQGGADAWILIPAPPGA